MTVVGDALVSAGARERLCCHSEGTFCVASPRESRRPMNLERNADEIARIDAVDCP
ncbi:hypothetical protein C499_09239 [Halogeometricum borinquense DSM 11551]|uniref:Uncharacterized protein n=1 Tax=Halogeometricum borinquense (strain ATCC 700274 / DSM 11551 / JCM 10706 / KCTC 4070 / PR3) TaxID=469382 RepID=E4NN39_HALBP|nr:hypothetical protein [Halogeometricum borinquense]ADQ66269.1 hypothetical protein Hbor_06700 [Halogeometricum borinquense DSM 11551]ELY27235.1 hypothetical protein C499_09239 [Halogeometricum borinquense DSM 11551]